MKCLKHLISFLLYLSLLSLCSTTCSPFNRTRRWHVLKSSVIAIEKHCFRPLKTLTLAPKKIAFVQGFFRLSPILIFSFPRTSFDLLPHLFRLSPTSLTTLSHVRRAIGWKEKRKLPLISFFQSRQEPLPTGQFPTFSPRHVVDVLSTSSLLVQ